MNLVFLNSFEKEVEEGGTAEAAQVSIAEELGEWHVWWYEPSPAGIPSQESWYKGPSWDRMLTEFRARLAEKREAGFKPLVQLAAQRESAAGGKAALARKLEYYAERHADEALFEALRRWRNAQAANEGKAAFILASNRLLRLLSAFKPHTPEELLQIPGFGEHKVSLYGQDLLALTAQSDRQTSFPLAWVDQAVGDAEAEEWAKKRQEQRRRGEASRGQTKRKLLEAIHAGNTLTQTEPLFSLSRRELVTVIEELDKEGYELDAFIDRELETIPEELVEQAWSEFKRSGDRYLRPVLQKLYDEKSLEEAAISRVYEWLRLLRIRYRKSVIDITESPGADSASGTSEEPESA
ncbi:HRDC domain-containing protein [Paenibacillus ginsengarvi]|uniref:Aldolase n=1 Tax=Paenibacillus ginsengarvi TaxID=400777 RepID=A0A3B0AWP6_9BACL|nr:HRDC domain-containing protein [Paenibacillus ginsengarvi]RKN64878.1 aldolase [Paenibacillus ginsengarvi]